MKCKYFQTKNARALPPVYRYLVLQKQKIDPAAAPASDHVFTTHHGKAFPSSHPFIFSSICDPYALPTQPESSADFESYAVQSIRFMGKNSVFEKISKGPNCHLDERT